MAIKKKVSKKKIAKKKTKKKAAKKKPVKEKQPKEKRLLGRPPKFTQAEKLEKANYYLENYKDEGDQIPSIVGLAVYLKIGRQTVYDWIEDNKNPEFSYMLGRLSTGQEHKTLNGGLSGLFNPTISKLVLAKHGYNETTGLDEGKALPLTLNFTVNPPVDDIQVTRGKAKSHK